MENHIENNLERIQKLDLHDPETMKQVASMILEYSWGHDYPVDPAIEHASAEYAVGAFIDEELSGISIVNRFSSPDEIDNGELWFADAVVIPEFRNRGIFTKLYKESMDYMLGQKGRILTCTDNPIMKTFLFKHGWQKIRETLDEDGGSCDVLEYKR